MHNFNCSSITCNDIKWEMHSKFISIQTYSKRKTIKSSSLLVIFREKNYGQPLMCPHCQSLDNSSIQHDYFLQCSLSDVRKEERLKAIATKLKALKIPPRITFGILTIVMKYYNNNELK